MHVLVCMESKIHNYRGMSTFKSMFMHTHLHGHGHVQDIKCKIYMFAVHIKLRNNFNLIL
jgi:hypothetical protein